MKVIAAGALVSRGVGVGLVLMGATSLFYLPALDPAGMSFSGWTSYSPLATNPPAITVSKSFATQLHDTYFLIAANPALYLPAVLQILLGTAMLWWSRTIGRWLARGLDRADEGEA